MNYHDANNLIYPINKLKALSAFLSPIQDDWRLELNHDEMYGLNWLLRDIAEDLEKFKENLLEEL